MALQAQPQAPSFLSGVFPNGQTPQTAPLPPQILAQRLRDAQEMRKAGADYSPIRSWTQGMARVADSLVGGYEERQAADQYQQGLQQGAQAGAGLLSGLWGGASSPGTGSPLPLSGTGSSAGPQASTPSASGAPSNAATAGGEPNPFLDAVAKGESGGDYNKIFADGKYGAPSQPLTSMTLNQAIDLAGNIRRNPQNPNNAGPVGKYQFVGTTLNGLKNSLGLSGDETFSPQLQDQLAWANANNTGGNPNALRAQWTSWAGKSDDEIRNLWQQGQQAHQAFLANGGYGEQQQPPATANAGPSAPGPYPTVAQNMAQADATAGQPLPAAPVQVASLDPSAGAAQAAAQQPPSPDTNIPLPPVDPRAGAIFNKGLGAPSPGQQVVANAAAGAGNAPSAPPLTPGQQTVANAVGGAGGDVIATPLTAGGQKVAQAVMPQGPAQSGQGGLSPELMQQYTAVMQNPYVSENEKAMINQAFMSRVMPHGVDNIDAGDHIIQVDKLTGQPLRSIPKAVPGVVVGADQNLVNPYGGNPMNGAPQTPAYRTLTLEEKREKGLPEDQFYQVDRAGKVIGSGGQTFNIGGPGDKYNEDIKTALADTPTALIKGIPGEQSSLYAIHAMQGALQRIKQNGGTTGVGTEELTKLKSAINTGANALGIAPLADTDNIADQNVLAKYNRQLAGAMAKSAAGARVTNFEMMNFLKSNPGQDTDPQGGERLLGIAEQMHARNLAVGQQIEDYAGQTQARGQKIDPGQISQIMRNYDEQHHITDPITGQDLVKNPTLPSAPPPPGPNQQHQGQSPVKLPITGDMNADWNSLMAIPEGDQYIGPNNQIYTKMNNSQYKKPGSK